MGRTWASSSGSSAAGRLSICSTASDKHGFIQASFVAEVLRHHLPAVLRANGDAGAELLQKAGSELLFGTGRNWTRVTIACASDA
jgi:hypothetical protein